MLIKLLEVKGLTFPESVLFSHMALENCSPTLGKFLFVFI